jgi:redox-sensitive bicupin YhaK (pirin superfamily)
MSAAPFDLLKPHVKDLGGFTVKRVLPGHPHKMVGPFIFFDHMGPARFEPGHGIEVRPHPHIGLATVTYLFDGTIMHRDSLGSVQPINPGDVNWMTAGRGIAHSERTPQELRDTGSPLHGIQTWVALPIEHEMTAPEFAHHPAATLPIIDMPGLQMRLIAGTAFGQRAPARTFSEMFYIAAEAKAGALLPLPDEHEERAVYAVEGELIVNGVPLPPHHMAVLAPGEAARVEARTDARVMLLGGRAMDGDRFIWWNFVASSREAIADAKQRWRAQEFGAIPDETEWIPLPDEPKTAESFS